MDKLFAERRLEHEIEEREIIALVARCWDDQETADKAMRDNGWKS